MINYDDTPIYVGTSGYKYDDWAETFYPRRMPNEDFLKYYVSQGLNFLELTFTLYTLPDVEDVERILENSGGDLSFCVRLHKSFMRGSNVHAAEFKEGIRPLLDAGLVKAFLADFRPEFSPSIENMDMLETLRDEFPEAPLYSQFSHRSWYKEKYLEDLRARDLGVCITDKKGVPYRPVMSPGPSLYFRLFGTNDGLDYNYSLKDMKSILGDIARMSVVCKNVFVSFCNVADAKAPKNARQFLSLISNNS